MGSKKSALYRKMMLANGAAVLAIASLFTIGFAAWEEVGGAGTADVNVNVNVENYSEKLINSDYETFVIYPTGIMQTPVSDTNRTYTTTPYLTFYLFFELMDGFQTTSTFENKFFLSFYTLDSNNTKTKISTLTAASGFRYWYIASNNDAIKNKADLNEKVGTSLGTTTETNVCSYVGNETFKLAKYMSLKIQWTINDTNANFKEFYTNIGSKSKIYFDLEIFGGVTNGQK